MSAPIVERLRAAARNSIQTALGSRLFDDAADEIERLKKEADKEDRDHTQTMEERDAYHAYADQLAECIAQMTGAEIGEHSSDNCPWEEAIEAAVAFIAYRNSSAATGSQSFPDHESSNEGG